MQIRLKFLISHLPCQLPSALKSLSGRRGEFVKVLLNKAMLLTDDLKVAHDSPTWGGKGDPPASSGKTDTKRKSKIKP